ncbi:DUF6090 family protein [Hanstruepera ponticola]|uniref:DUF6090 family protein n=1 Tax=Hanstruepera ponticola TaxID=2042995 RepID=UPI000CF061BC|nr:DUF6090 family protein [Hanstruepera ponticola]
MIKFFRHIRQSLIMENKTGKYFKYAIGEIILVVIGILIALQINNWNEGRKNSYMLGQYTNNLIEDLRKDSLDLSQRIKGIKADSMLLSSFEKRVSNSTKPLDTILKIARYDYGYYIWIKGDYNNDTYEVLNSTGDIGLFSSDIINDLNALHNLQESALDANAHTLESYLANIHTYAQKYPVPFQSNLIANGTIAADIIWEQISTRDHATEFNALVLAKGDSYRLSLRVLPIVLEKTNTLLAKFRKMQVQND